MITPLSYSSARLRPGVQPGKFLTAVCCAAAGALVSEPGHAATITITTLTGTNGADHYVSEHNNGGGSGDYGDFPEAIINDLYVRLNNHATLTSRRHEATYLRFDLSSIPDTEQIVGATLQLYRLGGTAVSFDLFGLNDSYDSLWNPATITYNSAPGMDNPGDLNPGTRDLNSAATIDLGNYSVSSGANSTKDFSSSAILAFLNADTNGYVTFILEVAEGAGTSTNRFRSSNDLTGNETSGAHAPRLVLETVTIPEPKTLLLAFLGLSGVAIRRSRTR